MSAGRSAFITKRPYPNTGHKELSTIVDESANECYSHIDNNETGDKRLDHDHADICKLSGRARLYPNAGMKDSVNGSVLARCGRTCLYRKPAHALSTYCKHAVRIRAMLENTLH